MKETTDVSHQVLESYTVQDTTLSSQLPSALNEKDPSPFIVRHCSFHFSPSRFPSSTLGTICVAVTSGTEPFEMPVCSLAASHVAYQICSPSYYTEFSRS